jgi:hypothetical protein
MLQTTQPTAMIFKSNMQSYHSSVLLPTQKHNIPGDPWRFMVLVKDTLLDIKILSKHEILVIKP